MLESLLQRDLIVQRVCHLTDLQNSAVMRRVGRGSKNHTVDSFLRSADALGA